MPILNQTLDQTTYTFNEHKHRYAVWTAARAVQRSFTTTEAISAAIYDCNIREFAEDEAQVPREVFDINHRIWCNSITDFFQKGPVPCSYGRAAKIIAIYLKTSYVLPTCAKGPNCFVIHPPVDSILLKSLSSYGALRQFKQEAWTTFDEKKYWEVVELVRKHAKCFDWRLEVMWKPEKTLNFPKEKCFEIED